MSPKTLTACIEILQNELNCGNEDRIESAYRSLVEIYMNCTNIDRCWLPLFRKALECVINDVDIRDHCKVYIKYLKILKHLKDPEALLRNAVSMLDIYPKEFIPLEMVCWVFVNRYEDKTFCFDVSKKVVSINHFVSNKSQSILNIFRCLIYYNFRTKFRHQSNVMLIKCLQ